MLNVALSIVAVLLCFVGTAAIAACKISGQCSREEEKMYGEEPKGEGETT